MARSLNRVQLIGNLTRDPELRYTPSGTAVCSFSIATNRNWTTDTGERKEEVEFHRIVAWNKLAELCSQFLTKGRKVFVEGRLTTRSWTAQDGTQKQTTEIIINDMILLDNRRNGEQEVVSEESVSEEEPKAKTPAKKTVKEKEELVQEAPSEDEVAPDDIPF
ncbi:MAG: single-stranded DNA-binding protein [Candidatus Levyibacteriota bacterium]|jgi:single-strand DNA-binding protein